MRMRAFLCLVLVSSALSALMPEGNARASVRMIMGLLGICMIAAFLRETLLNFL